MAVVQVKDLITKTLTPTLDLYVQEDAGGAGSCGKISMATMLKGLNTTTVYISSVDGTDAVGGGGQQSPYKTLAYAYSQVTDNSDTKPYIFIMSGIFNETTIAFKPFIYIFGQNSTLNVTNVATLDTTFSTGGILYIHDLKVNFIAGLNFDLSAYTTTSAIFLYDLFVLDTITWSITGSSTVGAILVTEFTFGTTSEINLEVTDCYGAFGGGALQSFKYTGNIIGLNFGLNNCEVLGDMLVQANATGGVSFNTQDGLVVGNYHLKTISTGEVSCINKNTMMLGILTIDALGSVLETTTLQISPTFTNGALTTQVIYLDQSDSINVGFSPVNYTAINSRVEGNLKGIDNALALMTSINPNARFISPTGSDTPTSGSLQKPYATLSYAESQVTVGASNNTVDLIILGGIITDSSQIYLKPYVNIFGMTQGTVINNSLPILYHPTFNVDAFPQVFISNVSFLGNFNLDFSAEGGEFQPYFQLFNAKFLGNFDVKGALAAIPLIKTTSCVFNQSNLEVCLVESDGNEFANLSMGSLTAVNNSQIESIGDSFGNFTGIAPNSGGVTGEYFFSSSTFNIDRTIQGANATIHIDATSIGPIATTLLSGATEILTTGMKAVNSSAYVPVNYTQTSPTVYGQIQGIDNALGSLSPSSTNLTIWVDATYGVDAVGNGSIEKPFKTIAYTFTQITTNSSTNTFCIKVTGNFTEGVQINFKKYCVLDGQGISTIATSFPIILDSDWGTGGGQGVIQNFLNFNSVLNIGFASNGSSFFVKNLRCSSVGAAFLSQGFTAQVSLQDVEWTVLAFLDFDSLENITLSNVSATVAGSITQIVNDAAFAPTATNFTISNCKMAEIILDEDSISGGTTSGTLSSSTVNLARLISHPGVSGTCSLISNDSDVVTYEFDDSASLLTTDKTRNLNFFTASVSQITYRQQNIGETLIGNGALAASASLEIISTTTGFLESRMTTAQRTAIVAPAEGLQVYDLDLHQWMGWNATAWVILG